MGALLALARDPAVSRVLARPRRDQAGREVVTVEVTRSGQVVQDPMILDPADLERLIAGLLGAGRSFGVVGVRGLQGIAALPPASDAPLLVLDRAAPSRAAPDQDGTISAAVAEAAVRILGAEAGVVLAGRRGPHIGAAVRAITGRLSPQAPLVMVEDGAPTPVRRDAVRLREVTPEALRAMRRTVVVIDRAAPPALAALAGSVLVVVAARTPEGAVARLAAAPEASPAARARMCADTAPLLLWFDRTPRGAGLVAAYEILPHPDGLGLPALQMLAGTDPETGALVPTGAVPVDPALRDAWTAVGS